MEGVANAVSGGRSLRTVDCMAECVVARRCRRGDNHALVPGSGEGVVTSRAPLSPSVFVKILSPLSRRTLPPYEISK